MGCRTSTPRLEAELPQQNVPLPRIALCADTDSDSFLEVGLVSRHSSQIVASEELERHLVRLSARFALPPLLTRSSASSSLSSTPAAVLVALVHCLAPRNATLLAHEWKSARSDIRQDQQPVPLVCRVFLQPAHCGEVWFSVYDILALLGIGARRSIRRVYKHSQQVMRNLCRVQLQFSVEGLVHKVSSFPLVNGRGLAGMLAASPLISRMAVPVTEVLHVLMSASRETADAKKRRASPRKRRRRVTDTPTDVPLPETFERTKRQRHPLPSAPSLSELPADETHTVAAVAAAANETTSLARQLADTKEALATLQMALTCSICMVYKSESRSLAAFASCGHVCCCECIARLPSPLTCPMCRCRASLPATPTIPLFLA